MLMAIFGILDFSRALYTYHFVSYAAQEGARYAMVRGGDWGTVSCSSYNSYDCQATAAEIQSYVQSLAPPGIGASKIVATPSWPQETASGSSTGCSTTGTQADQGCIVKVAVSYQFQFILPFLPNSGISMKASSEQVISY